jgi:autotransporter-associated beta strand protein
MNTPWKVRSSKFEVRRKSEDRKFEALKRLLVAFVCAQAVLTVSSASAQAIRFRMGQVRVTVPINSGNSTTITNLVNLTGVTNADLSVSGLPAGASAVLTDTNGVVVTTVTTDTNLWLTVNTTNIAEGIYTFSLNASGQDTNGAPVANDVLLVLQAAHLWKGANGLALGVSNAWSTASSWLGGVPGVGNDVVFTDLDAQTNIFASGFAFTNSTVDANITIGSLRFSQTGVTNAIAADPADSAAPRSHTLRISPGVTLSITGTNGLSLMRDYVDDIQVLNRPMFVNIVGGAGSKLVVSNANANFGVVLGNQSFTGHSLLNSSNLENMVVFGSRFGVAEYQFFPNYRNYNDLNQFNDSPRRFTVDIFLPRTNVVTAIWKDPDNYNNELTRTYAMSYQNSEVFGVGSQTTSLFYLGQSNAFFLDSVCFVRSATGGGTIRFNPNYANATAIFRSTNGGRLSVFTVSDDGGTNGTQSNVKATVDFASGNGSVDLLVDRLYVSRDRTMIASNGTPNVQGDVTFGRGIVDANTVILGFQEHSNKVDWTTIGGAQPYLNYCQGRMVLTNGGTFRVNGNLTLGFTADTNPEGSAQQYNTYGQITVYTNTFLMVSNLIVDGGLNFTSATARRNDITLNQGSTMIISNTIGGAPGLPLDDLIMNGATNVMFVDPARTNILVRNLQTPGVTPSVIKIASLTGVSSYPAQIPLISYQTAAPFIVANVTALGAGFSGYVLDNQPNKTVDVYITTNPPNNLIWRGNVSSDWDTTTKNWVTAVGGIQTNFSIGDSVTFDDSSSVNNINVVGSVVPGQSGNGVTVNSTHNYNFSGAFGATIAGTSLLVKQGSGNLDIEVVKQGPVVLSAGVLTGGGTIGATTIFSNATLNFSGFINGGLTSTGNVFIANSATVFGPVALRGGVFSNSGIVSNTPIALAVSGTVLITNTASGTMYVAGGSWDVPFGCTLANFGTINNLAGRLNFEGLFFGTGSVLDPDSGLITGIDGRLSANPLAIWSPGATPSGSIGTMNIGARVDLNNTPNTAPFGVAELLIEVDFNNPQTNDMVLADKWNNITGMILMTNINPVAGSFASGQVFQIFANNNGSGFVNTIDVNGTYPTMWPPVPAPGLQWGLGDFRAFGTISVTNPTYVWNGNINGNWDTNTANWKGGNIYSDGLGVMLDDSAIGTTTITLTNVVAPIGFATVTTFTTNGSTITTNIFTNTPTMSPGMVVSNSAKSYFVGGTGKISGMTGLYKMGSGTLTILTSNDFSGNVVIDGGTVVFSNTVPSGNITAFGLSGNNNEVIVDGGALRYIGTTNVNFNNFLLINPNNATVEVSSATNELTLNKTMVGSGALTKTGAGTLVLTAGADTYAGGTTISAGALRLTAAAAGSGSITLTPGSILQITNAFTFTNGLTVAGSPTTIQVLGNATNISSGLWSGSGATTLSSTGAVQLILNAAMTNFSGTLSQAASTNNIRFNNSTNSNPNRGSTAATFDLGTGAGSLNNLNGNNLIYDLGALSGGPNTVLFGSSTNMGVPACTYSVGANGSNTTFLGRITNGVGAVSITKVGNGILALGGNSTYSGGTTVSGGTLLVNNTAESGTGSGAVSVTAGTLGGTGAISGAVSVGAGGNLAPGTSIGTLAINNSLSLAGTTTMEVSRNGFALASDRVVGLTSVSFGGSLVVSNIGPDALAQGNSFQLFNIGGTGNFTSITPALALPLAWIFNPATGLLSVTGPQPTLNYVNNGNGLTFSWVNGGGYTFKLQSQTNSIDVGISNNWFDYPGGGTSGVTVPINSAQGTVFFRLVSTP